MSKIAAIGRRHFVGAFAAVGAETVACATPDAFAAAAERLLAGGSPAGRAPALVLLDQHLAACGETIGLLRRRGGCVLLLPAEPTEGHPALDAIRALVERAAGANILGEY